MYSQFNDIGNKVKLWGHTVAACLIFLFILTFSSPLNEPSIFWVLLIFGIFLIIIVDVIQILPQLKLKTLETELIQVRALIRLIGYIFIFILFFVYPPGSPVTFIIPIIASLDFYFLLASWWSLGILLVGRIIIISLLNN